MSPRETGLSALRGFLKVLCKTFLAEMELIYLRPVLQPASPPCKIADRLQSIIALIAKNDASLIELHGFGMVGGFTDSSML